MIAHCFLRGKRWGEADGSMVSLAECMEEQSVRVGTWQFSLALLPFKALC